MKKITYKDFPEIAAFMEKHNTKWHSDEVWTTFHLGTFHSVAPTWHHPRDWQTGDNFDFFNLSVDEQILFILFIYQAIKQS